MSPVKNEKYKFYNPIKTTNKNSAKLLQIFEIKLIEKSKSKPIQPAVISTLMPKITNLLVFALHLAVLIFFLPTWQSLSNLWLKMDYPDSYGVICMALGLFTAYQNRKKTLTIKAKPSYLALILLIGAIFTWFWSHYLKIQIGAQLILVPIIFFIIASLYGKKVALSQTVPLLYLLLSIPIWDYLNTALQSLTTLVAPVILETTSLAFFFESNRITLHYVVIEIEGG